LGRGRKRGGEGERGEREGERGRKREGREFEAFPTKIEVYNLKTRQLIPCLKLTKKLTVRSTTFPGVHTYPLLDVR